MFDNANFLSSLFLEFTRTYQAVLHSHETENFAVRADQIVAYKDNWLYLSNGDQYEVMESYDEITEKITAWRVTVYKDMEKFMKKIRENT